MSKNNRNYGKSIARRLNAALTRRTFAKTLVIDILAAALVLVTWCYAVEASHGGNAKNRSIAVENNFDVIYNTCEFAEDIQQYFYDISNHFRPEIDWTLPFEGVYYTFGSYASVTDSSTVAAPETEAETELVAVETALAESDSADKYGYYVSENGETTDVPVIYDASDVPLLLNEHTAVYEETEVIPDTELTEINRYQPVYNTHKVDASGILTVTVGAFLLLVIVQSVSAVVNSLAGGGLIKKYLRPIDDMAIMAEQLSTETHTTTEEKIRATYSSAEQSEQVESKDGIVQNEPSLDASDVEELTVALDGIDDSRKRLDIGAPELSGLEAAVNNMLKRLEEGRRKQIRFVDDASHELRTPISVIQGYANMLDRWGKEDPKIRDEAIEAIKNESEHMKTLLDQLLFLARGEMDRHVMELKPVSIDVVLCEVLEESQMIDKRHTYEISLASGEALEDDILENDVLILADVAMIKQSVRILCDNAVKYTPEGGTISLKTSERVSSDENGKIRREVCIDVTDTGIGISSDELPRIFDRFYRGENARADNTGGSGLGLSIARWIVEQHNGRIEAISSPGFGTKMTIILPEYTPEKQA